MVAPDYYVPPPTRCETLADLCAHAGGTITPIPSASVIATASGTVASRIGTAAPASAIRVHYTLPTHATTELSDFLSLSATLDCPAPFLAHFAGGRVFGPGHVLSSDGRSIARDVSLDFGKAPAEHWLLTYKKIRQPKALPGSTAVIATSLGAGYCHWLLEELPRLLALGPELSRLDSLIAHTAQPFAREALALGAARGWTGQFIEPARLSHYQCADLTVPTLLGPEGRPTPAVVSALTDFVASFSARDTSSFGDRLYVTREKARRRRVTNEAELWSFLEPHGFAKISLEDLTWREQIAAFRHARQIVAPHGAGLANLVFCTPGTQAVELFNRGYVNGLFWQLAALKGLDYRPIVAPGTAPLAQLPAANRDDISIDLAQLRLALAV